MFHYVLLNIQLPHLDTLDDCLFNSFFLTSKFAMINNFLFYFMEIQNEVVFSNLIFFQNWFVFSLEIDMIFFFLKKKKTQNWSIFSLNTNLNFFFQNPKLICIFIKYRTDFFKTQNQYVFSLNTDLIFFKTQN